MARLESAAMTGPLSRDTAKLQAYSPALRECLDSHLFPDNQDWVEAASDLVHKLENSAKCFMDWAPHGNKGTYEHNSSPYTEAGYNRAMVKQVLEGFRTPIASGAYHGKVRCRDFMAHADMVGVRAPSYVQEFQVAGRVVQGFE